MYTQANLGDEGVVWVLQQGGFVGFERLLAVAAAFVEVGPAQLRRDDLLPVGETRGLAFVEAQCLRDMPFLLAQPGLGEQTAFGERGFGVFFEPNPLFSRFFALALAF